MYRYSLNQTNRSKMPVWECALGFMNSQILFAAEEIGVFKAVADGGGTLDDIMRETDLPRESARRLVTALCALDLLEKQGDGRILNTPEAADKLVPGRPGYIGGMFRHLSDDLYPLWTHLKEALYDQRAQWHRLTDGDAPRNEEIYDDPEALGDFHEGMFAISYDPAREFGPRLRELETAEHVVDVGGSSGAFLIALAEAFPHLRGIVFDLPPLQPIAESFFARYGMEDRLSFEAGDFWNDPLPQGADVYSLGFVLHDWDEDEGSILLQKIADAIRPGGTLVVGEYLLNEDRTGPLHVARQDINMLVAARGRERTAREYAEWIGTYGFQLDRIERTGPGKHFLVAHFEGSSQDFARDDRTRSGHRTDPEAVPGSLAS